MKILFPHVLGGSSVVEDEHLRSLCFGDYMHPEAEKKIYDEIPDVTLLTKAMDHYLKVVFFSLSYHTQVWRNFIDAIHEYSKSFIIVGIQYRGNCANASRYVSFCC